MEPGLAGKALSLMIVGIVTVISVGGARLPGAVTGVLYICQRSSFYGFQLQHEIAFFFYFGIRKSYYGVGLRLLLYLIFS